MLVIAFFIISVLHMMYLQHPTPFQLWLSILFVDIVMMFMHNMFTLGFHWYDMISVIYAKRECLQKAVKIFSITLFTKDQQ